MSNITVIRNKKNPLSHFYICKFYYDGIEFHSSAQCFQYLKAKHVGDQERVNIIIKSRNPFKCFITGRQIKNCDKNIEYNYMYIAAKTKFTYNKGLSMYLRKTGTSIICQPSKRDRYWGIGLQYNDPKIQMQQNWKGKNETGRILMRIREEILHDG